MKILLVNPGFHGIFTLFGLVVPPLSIGYLAAALRAAGKDVTILDLNVMKLSEVGSYGDYDIVGISADTSRIYMAWEMAKEAKAQGAIVVMGGPHPTTADEEVLRESAVDYVVRSEGETTLLELMNALENGEDPEKIPGLTFRRNGQLVRTPDRAFVEDLDTILPPARDLFPMERYTKSLLGKWHFSPVITSRGCPYRCAFCASSFMNGPRWRPHSAKRVADEIEEVVVKWGYRAVAFTDDNSTLSPKRNLELAEELLRRNIDVKIWAFARADTAARHPESFEALARAGLCSVFIGIESPSKHALDSVDKGIGEHDVKRALKVFRRNGIEIMGSYIVGLLDDTLGSIRETIRMARDNDTNTAQFTILTPYPGTKIYEQLKHRITRKDWRLYDGHHLVFRHKNLSRFTLEISLAWAHSAFYLRSIRSVLGMFRFFWQRRKCLGSFRKAANDIVQPHNE